MKKRKGLRVARDLHERHLTRREREIMDIVFRLGKATANDVLDHMHAPPSHTAVRTFLSILEKKGHLRHTMKGRAYLYEPTRPRTPAGRSAMRRVLDTFFRGSVGAALAAYLSDPDADLRPDELELLEEIIREAREKGD